MRPKIDTHEPHIIQGRAMCSKCEAGILCRTFIYPGRSLYVAFCSFCKHLELAVVAELLPKKEGEAE